MRDLLANYLEGKKVLIAGFGVEGRSTYSLLRRFFPQMVIGIADRQMKEDGPEALTDKNTIVMSGAAYLDRYHDFDVVVKSPGIRMDALPRPESRQLITSQTALFLEAYRRQVIGITGTKGKTTTAHLVHHLLGKSGCKSLLVGNMGYPPFDVVEQVDSDTRIVFELSSHQLEHCRVSPHIAVLLNIFQEHLDHYASYRLYQMAKSNIATHQQTGDFFIYSMNNERSASLVREFRLRSTLTGFSSNAGNGARVWLEKDEILSDLGGSVQKIFRTSHLPLQGEHNQSNMMAAAAACLLAGLTPDAIGLAAAGFATLPHRMEFVGEFGGKLFYNDSIATIPEAAMMAVTTLRDVDSLILGGFDRGIDYGEFIDFLAQSGIRQLLFTGQAGIRMMQGIAEKHDLPERCLYFERFDDAVIAGIQHTRQGRICLLSPAASSYDQFRNFEHRGQRFRELIQSVLNDHTRKL